MFGLSDRGNFQNPVYHSTNEYALKYQVSDENPRKNAVQRRHTKDLDFHGSPGQGQQELLGMSISRTIFQLDDNTYKPLNIFVG